MALRLLTTASVGLEAFSKVLSGSLRKYHKLSSFSCISLITNKMLGTGLFSTPGIIFKYTDGNVGLYLFLWLLGAAIVFSGLLIYLEYALNLPFTNGGEKNYLLRVFKHPKGLAGCVYAFQMVLLGFSSGNSFAFGKYVWFAFTGIEADENDWNSKLIGVACISFCIFLHIRFPNQGTSLFNFLGVFKVLILILIVLLGALVGMGAIDLPPTGNFTDVWNGSHTTSNSNSYYLVSVALLEIIYSFKGWENANYVLSEVEDPYHVLTVAAPLAVLLVTILYFFVIMSYLMVIPKTELLNSGVLVAGIFFNKIFGESATSKVLPIMIAFSTLGNVLVVSFAHSHVNQELARNNYLPFSRYFENINHSLVLHWAISVFILVAPPSSEIYEFVVNLYIYPGTWINLFITAGLIYLRLNLKREKWGPFNAIHKHHTNIAVPDFQGGVLSSSDARNLVSEQDQDDSYTEFDSLISIDSENSQAPDDGPSFGAPYVCLFLFLFGNLFLALFPFVPPPPSDVKSSIPYWCFPVVGTGALVLGAAFYHYRNWYTKYVGEEETKYEEEYQLF